MDMSHQHAWITAEMSNHLGPMHVGVFRCNLEYSYGKGGQGGVMVGNTEDLSALEVPTEFFRGSV